MRASYRLGIDIGGTFTDAILINEETGEINVGKVPSTPADPSIGFLDATDRMLSRHGVAPDEVVYVVHGTTVATNSIIEGNVARTGFVTTDGFRDLLEIQRQIRPAPYDLNFHKPRPLVPRYLCYGIPERIDAQGNVITPLDEEAVQRVAEDLANEQVEAVAVCLLHSYISGDHEQRVGAILRDSLPGVVVSLSSDIAPEFREYYRASTTVINASIRPVVARYLDGIEQRLREIGLQAELLVMQSSGGVYTFQSASQRPVYMVESGPAAGVIAAAHLGQVLGRSDVLSFDMGGTTAKASMIQAGTPRVTKDYEVGATAQPGVGASRGSGYPIRTPVIDLVEVGAGGGSIAWVDPGGALRVGPHSAGADPGPVCYQKGGTDPTITDANLVLGRLNADYFLGSEIQLDRAAAESVIQEKCARPLRLDVTAAAHSIVEIANAAMVNALRLVSVQRGFDPREFVLMAFGGAGPLHANRLAEELSVPVTIVPQSPGTTSAMGLLVTDLKHDYSTTMIQNVEGLDFDTVFQVFESMEVQGRASLGQAGKRDAEISCLYQIDMRYVGQSYELGVSVGGPRLDDESLSAMLDQFHAAHDRAYGYRAPSEPVEVVTLRLTAIGRIAKPRSRRLDRFSGDVSAALKATRPVFFRESSRFVDCPIYDRYQLGAGVVIQGPSIVEENDSTTVVHPGYGARVDEYGNLLLMADST